MLLNRVDIFKTQLKAILRANTHGNLKLMFPIELFKRSVYKLLFELILIRFISPNRIY